MLLSRSVTVLLATLGFLTSTARFTKAFPQTTDQDQATPTDAAAISDAAPADCRVTLPADGRFTPPKPFPSDPDDNGVFSFWFGSEKLWTILPIDGTWRSWSTAKPGDYVYSNKLPWYRMHPAFSRKDGQLTVTGKRLDGPAPSFVETFESNFFRRDDDNAMIMGGISIPTFGCWEITGHYKDDELTFTVWVVPPSEKDVRSAKPTPPISEAPPFKTRRVRIDGDVEAKELVYKVIPDTPAAAKSANVSGTVVLHAIIGTDGRPHELEYVSGPPLLLKAAIDAVKWWQYRVTMTDDQELKEVDTTVDVVFPPPTD